MSFFILAMALMLIAAGCTNKAKTGGTASEKKTVAIAFVGPKTGSLANLGLNALNGAKLAVDQANAAGDLDVKLELKEFDTQGSGSQASTLKDQFINDAEIIGIVGPIFSGETKAIIPSLEEAGLVMISPSATNVQLPTIIPTENVFHRLIPDDDIQGKGVSDYVTKVLKLKTMAFIHDNSDYGKAVAEGTRDLLKGAGVAEAFTDAVDPASQDYSAVVNKVVGASPQPDGIFYGGYYAESGRLAKQLRDAGYKGKFVSGDGSLDVGFVDGAGTKGAEGAVLTCACTLATTDAPGPLGKFAKDFKKSLGTNAGTYSTEGFDAANIFIDGIRKGNKTRPSLLKFVEGITTYDGISKKLEILPNGNVKSGEVFAYEVKDGKIVNLGTIDQLTK